MDDAGSHPFYWVVVHFVIMTLSYNVESVSYMCIMCGLLIIVPETGGSIGEFLKFVYWVGRLVCFQWEAATFRVGAYYLPVCSGCLGIYTGALIGFASLTRLSNLSQTLFKLRVAIPLLLPMSIYFFILNIERYVIYTYPIPGIKTVYFALGLLFGFVLCNIALRLALLEDEFHPTADHYIIKFVEFEGWLFLPSVLVGIISIMLGLILVGYAFDILLLVLGSLSFIIGLFTLLILIIGFGLRLSLGIFKAFQEFYTRPRSN